MDKSTRLYYEGIDIKISIVFKCQNTCFCFIRLLFALIRHFSILYRRDDDMDELFLNVALGDPGYSLDLEEPPEIRNLEQQFCSYDYRQMDSNKLNYDSDELD